MADDIFIRASSLSGHPDCGRRSAARVFSPIVRAMGYVLREMPSSIGASVGTGVHAGAALTLQHKAEHGTLGPADAAIDCAVDTLRAEISDGIIYDRETPEMNTAERQVIRMTECYRAQVAPQIQPLRIEEQLEAEVRPGLVLTGRADAIAREPGTIRDLKTGKRMGNHNPQIGAYSMLARSTGIDINSAAIDHVQRTSIKKPQPDAVTLRLRVADAEIAAVRIINQMASELDAFMNGRPEQGLLPGDPWAFTANPQSMLCSAKWCPAHGTSFCREHARDADGDE